MAFQDFDLISQRRQEERRQKKKKIIIAVTLSVLILLIAAAAVAVVFHQNNQTVNTKESHKAPPKPSPSAVTPSDKTEKAVKSVCATTDYKETCEEGLLKSVKANSENSAGLHENILRAAFFAASDEIEKAIKKASDLKIKGPLKKKAFEDCLELLEDAKDELNSSVAVIKGKDMAKLSSITPEINNWLSAVLTYQQTCIDGFPDGEEKTAMQKLLNTSKEHGSNALAIVSEISTTLGKVQSQRKLLGMDEARFPTWIDHEYRRLLKADATKFTPNVTVAKDGSGKFKTINEALKAMPEKYTGRYVIFIKEGVYDETVIITKKMVNVTMYGEGSQKSIITGSKNYVDGVPTFQTASFAAIGEGFMAQSLGFRNTAGPEKHQAVALRVQSDRSIFLNCRMEGYQDTLYAQTHRQFYRGCYITGTIDFIFGNAAAIFQNCLIYVRKPMESQKNIVTAQGRLDKRQTTGIVLHNCRILAADTLKPEKAKFKSYLGRPWKEYSRTIIMETEIGDLIQPEGWLEWEGDFALKTLFYAEFNNKGPGASTMGRVKWPGYKSIKKDEALEFTVGPFLQGESWIKNADVPVRFGMFA
ncbi:putative pectinesterase/pectinesterase inhibitor 45 [Sesamum alatum]|uniref:Pectinesterase n=1 Tax=Sesamum alatum TaxID=300844 RepID=A0AAE1YM52_9LAMI|nr:putative pectinesterase/pectinesterase inhibitor 45 [Sesamum alatum]